jgi:hypothetical protein
MIIKLLQRLKSVLKLHENAQIGTNIFFVRCTFAQIYEYQSINIFSVLMHYRTKILAILTKYVCQITITKK